MLTDLTTSKLLAIALSRCSVNVKCYVNAVAVLKLLTDFA